jgi:predicted 3-demethylubiquinone-9 3-methyltransferase (glyoxalase superfamily)
MPDTVTQKLSVFLMFHGNAEEAMNFYLSAFGNGEVVHVIRARAEDAGWTEGTLQYAIFKIADQQVVCMNTPPPGSRDYNIARWYEFKFNPAMTIYVERESKEDFDQLYEALIEGGKIYLPAQNAGFSPMFAWVSDRYGISWRISLSSNLAQPDR